jgi:hypothetical protein
MKGGRRSSTWENVSSKWSSGDTRTIRVPTELVSEILEYARWLDQHVKSSLAQGTQGDFSCNVVLQAIDKYIEWRRDRKQPNQHSREVNINVRTWDELRKFRAMVASGDMGTNFKASD